MLAVDTRSWHGLDAHPAGMILLPAGVAQIRRQAIPMFALITPVLLPFILLGAVLGLSWWEDRLLPPAGKLGGSLLPLTPVTHPASDDDGVSPAGRNDRNLTSR